MEFVRDFNKLSKKDVSLAGGKGASLGEMIQAGIPVPPGFVVLSTTFDEFIKEADLVQEIDAILDKVDHKEIHTVENASEKIQALIKNAKMSERIASEIKAKFKDLKTEFVAVRSSATAEDGAENAWAGQLDSFLNTKEADLLEKVQHCWASLFTPRAIFYRFEKDLHAAHISVAVVVQKMINSELSGIAFSVHPVTMDRNQMIVEGGFGLGEAIVSGQITPDSYVVEKDPRRIIDINVSTQSRALYRVQTGGNEWLDIPESRASSQVLTEAQILEFADLIMKIENHYGFPCDIEWAFEKGKFYIVQSRPMTTLINKTSVSLGDKISKFLNENSTFPIFVRPYSLTMILALYDAYLYKYKEETGENIINVSIYSNIREGVNFYEFVVDFGDYNSKIHQKINKIDGYSLHHEGIDLYYKRVKEFKDKINKFKEKKNNFTDEIKDELFNLASRILSFESLLFVIPFLDNDLKMEIKDKILLKKATKARLDTEKFFMPNGELDSFLGLLNYIPPYLAGFTQKSEEFILFDNKFVYEKKIIDTYKNALAIKQGLLKNIKELKGSTAFGGVVSGVARIILSKADFIKMKEGDIIIANTTTPDYINIIKNASAIIADEGGVLSHASIVSRELKIPCVIGTQIASKVIKDGDNLFVDANNGIIRILQNNIN